jgi:putative membrane protein
MHEWIRAFHVIAVISWMAGLLYLPRLFVYHAGVAIGSEMSETFKVMERRLLRGIILPAAGLTWILGAILAWQIGLQGNGWLHAKMALVVLLTVFTHALGRYRRAFAEDRNQKSQKFFRLINEVPTVLMIAIVILVEVKPF